MSSPIIGSPTREGYRADAPRFAIAAFISSIDTVRLGLPNMPLRLVTERVAGTISNRSGSTSTNSTRSPASSPRASRTSIGIVIYPLLVRVAAAMADITIRKEEKLFFQVVQVSQGPGCTGTQNGGRGRGDGIGSPACVSHAIGAFEGRYGG